LISRINQNDPDVVVDDYFRTVFNKSVEVHRISDGAFDITITPIVNLWGFGFTGDTPDMDAEKIDSLLQYVGLNKVRIVDNKVVKDSPGIMFNMNAIAKGYSADVLADFFIKNKIRNFLINIGGEIVARGVNETGYPWLVGIDFPDENAFHGEDLHSLVRLKNRAMATSGNYRRFFEVDGKKYGHTFDPRTGYPVNHNLLSATVVADDCMTADAWATVFLVSGLERSIELLKLFPEIDAILIYVDENNKPKTYVTKGVDLVLLK